MGVSLARSSCSPCCTAQRTATFWKSTDLETARMRCLRGRGAARLWNVLGILGTGQPSFLKHPLTTSFTNAKVGFSLCSLIRVSVGEVHASLVVLQKVHPIAKDFQ